MKFVIIRQKFREMFWRNFEKSLKSYYETWSFERFFFKQKCLYLEDKKVLLHKQAIFSTFSDKMAYDSLHFVIYCFSFQARFYQQVQ